MRSTIKGAAKRVAFFSSAATIALSSPALAQSQDAEQAVPASAAADAADDGEQIVVTGTRIFRRDLETAAPIAVVKDEEFKLSGSVNVEQVLNTLPQVIPGTTAFSNNPGGGVATLNLRGLGSNRSLVLVNGRRWMFYDTAQLVDLNTIPTFLLDSVDVVTGGASAVYGSDAIAGVVNFRLRNDLNGIEVGGQYSITGEGDGKRYNSYVALGGDLGDRGHATVYAEYYKRRPIFAGARDFSADTLGDDGEGGFIPAGSGTTPQGRFRASPSGTNNGCPTGNIFCGSNASGSQGGAFFEQPGIARVRTGDDVYNYAPVNYLQVPQERYLIGGYADYDVGGGHTAYAEVSFVNNRVANELAPTPVTGTFNVDIATVTPFLNPGLVAQLQQLDNTAATSGAAVGDGVVPLNLARRVSEVGPRNTLDERNAFRLLGGIHGPITDKFNYDFYYSYARTRNSNIQSGNVSTSAFQAGLDGTGDPINIFGPGTLTPEMANQIAITAQNADISTLQVLSGSVSGSLFNLGWGGDDIGLAVGAEYRKIASEFIPDTALSSGDVIGFNAGLPTKGDYDVKEIFGELRIPIAARVPWAYKAELSGAARYSDYSLDAVGGVWTYAIQGEYAPVKDVTFRAQYQRAVRAPNVGELFGGLAQGFPGAVDPCAVPANASNPTIVALCEATGVPVGSTGDEGLQTNTQIEGTFGGNPNLQEEVSDSYTAGAVIRPSFLPGFSATIDYFNIKVKGAIGTFGGGLNNALHLCYDVFQDINSPFCQVFVGTRNASGQIETGPGVPAPVFLQANTAQLQVEGVDLQLDYSTRLPFQLIGDTDAKLNLFFLGTYTSKSDFAPVQENPDEVNHCAGRFGVLACGNPTPKYKWTSRASLITGPLTTSLRWRHLSSVKDDDPNTDFTVEKLPAYDVFDLSLGYDVNDNLSLTAGVNNLFDKEPPLIGDNQEQSNTYPGTYDVLGRDFFVSARIKL